MRLAELGEFGLINLLNSIFYKSKDSRRASWKRLLVGIGDDAAAWQGNNYIQLATTDSLVQDIHFDLDNITWEELGWKALAVNISDIAAMGGTPQYALISLAAPAEIEVSDISKFCNGLACLAAKFGIAIAGGNLTAASDVVITITLLGYSKSKSVLRRSTATLGNQVAVTGHLGLSAAGLEMLKERISLDAETTDTLRRGHLHPIPKVREGQILIKQGVRTAIDISDGLIADLAHICEASKVGARIKIEQVPVHPLVKANFPNYRELALYGGEDYELLFTANKAIIEQVKQAVNCPVTVIGDIVEETMPNRVVLFDGRGNIIPYKKGGWEHFRNKSSKVEIT
jgi:thiamine-monophosphate kinase